MLLMITVCRQDLGDEHTNVTFFFPISLSSLSLYKCKAQYANLHTTDTVYTKNKQENIPDICLMIYKLQKKSHIKKIWYSTSKSGITGFVAQPIYLN